MSSTPQLWAPKPQRASQDAVERIDRPNMIPGTWLTLTPTSSTQPSPALSGENVSPVDLISLSLADERYLSNSASRQSSVSSTSNSISTRAPAFLSAPGPSVERREMAIGRLGGLGGAFLSN